MAELTPREIDQLLTDRVLSLCGELLPAGKRIGHEWRCGSVWGEAGNSLGIHLDGEKAGVWSDFSTGQSGRGLDLVGAVLGFDLGASMRWAQQWLGIAPDYRPLKPKPKPALPPTADPDNRWRFAWNPAQPIAGTLAETYLRNRGLSFDDLEGRVLRFCPRRARLSPDGSLEHHPAMLAALCDVRTGEQCGVVNTYLRPDGSDRIRDRKGKTVTSRAKDAAVMLSAFDEPTMGLVICEGTETGIAILMTGLAPVWALGGAGNLGTFPVLGGIECLTIAADAGPAGQFNARKTADRWRAAGREVLAVTPPHDDWAAGGQK
jgi:hypothetical protein